MRGFIKRLTRYPSRTCELILSSFAANIFALGPPIYVILILNKYVAYGVLETLYTLSAGVLILIALEYYFRRYKYGVAETICKKYSEAYPIKDISDIFSTNPKAMSLLSPNIMRKIVNGYSSIQKNYDAKNLSTLTEAPFALFFILIIYLISPELGYITFCFVIFFGIFLIFIIKSTSQEAEEIHSTRNTLNVLSEFVLKKFETIENFDIEKTTGSTIKNLENKINNLRGKQSNHQDNIQCIIKIASAFMTIFVVGVGAVLVDSGRLNIGEMIGINILAARSLIPIIGLAQQAIVWQELRAAEKTIKDFDALREEENDGIAIKNLDAAIVVRNVSFSYGPRKSFILDHLNLDVFPSNSLCVYGSNGVGKTTLLKLLLGHISPQNGTISIDGINLEQISKVWWRTQIIYVPQYPEFFEGTIRQNFLAFNKELSADNIRKLISSVGLEKEVDSTPLGIDTNIKDVPMSSSLGLKKRLSWARALAHNGKLVLIDDPTIGMDPEGVRIILGLITQLVTLEKTVIIVSNDDRVRKGCSSFLNLDDGRNAQIKSMRTR